MVCRKLDSAKTIAVRLVKRGGHSQREIADICGFSTRTLTRAVTQYRRTGNADTTQIAGRRGRKPILHKYDLDYLIRISQHQPAKFLDEYQDLLARLRHCPVHITTIHYAFCRAGINVKRIQRMASERDPVLEGDFIARIAEYPANYLVAVDEMAKDDRTYARLGGRAPIGQRVEVYQPFVRKKRYTVIGGMALDKGMIATRVIEGSSDHDTFYDFLEKDLLPMMNPYPGPCSVLVLDNAKIHHSDDIQQLVEDYGALYSSDSYLESSLLGCRIEYLPPYSPHLNPIEQAWSAIKSHLRRIGLAAFSSRQAYLELHLACRIITPEMTWGFFRHSGLI